MNEMEEIKPPFFTSHLDTLNLIHFNPLLHHGLLLNILDCLPVQDFEG